MKIDLYSAAEAAKVLVLLKDMKLGSGKTALKVFDNSDILGKKAMFLEELYCEVTGSRRGSGIQHYSETFDMCQDDVVAHILEREGRAVVGVDIFGDPLIGGNSYGHKLGDAVTCLVELAEDVKEIT